jgi:ATP phosphoribosyltransferase regulatory subunit
MTQRQPLAQGMSIKGKEIYSKEDALIYSTLKCFDAYGYDVIEPPSIEYYDVMKASGKEAQQNMIKFIDPYGDIMVLQADPTMSLAHYMSKQSDTSLRKFAMVSPIHRAYTLQSKRHEHFKQVGIEVFYDQGNYDEEVCELALKAIQMTQINDVVIELGHVMFIPTLLQTLNVPFVLIEQMIPLIQAKDIPLLEKTLVECPHKVQTIIKHAMMWFGPVEEVIEKVKTEIKDAALLQIVDELIYLANYLKQQDPSANVILDLTTQKSLSYYQGLTISAYSTMSSQPLLSGGRYTYKEEASTQPMSAIGFGLNVALCAKLSSIQPQKASNIAIITTPEDKLKALQKAKELRDLHHRVHVMYDNQLTLNGYDEVIVMKED